MKKLLLVSAIAAMSATTTASAFELANKDGFTFGLSGEYAVQALSDVDTDDVDFNYEDFDLNFTVGYEISNSTSVFGFLGTDSASGSLSVGNHYIGLKTGGLTTTAGTLDWGSDSFGIGEDYELGGSNAFGTTGGDESIKFDYGMGKYNVALSHDVELHGADLFVGGDLGPVSAGLAYQTLAGVDTIGVMGSMGVGKATVGVDYSETDTDIDAVNFSVGFPVAAKTSAAVGAGKYSTATTDTTKYYANVTHKLHSKVKVYAEVGSEEGTANDELGYLAGMSIKF